MGSIIVAMPKHEDASRISGFIRKNGIWDDLIQCTKGSDILRVVQDMDISLVICTRKFKDMGIQELSDYIPDHIPILLLIKDISMAPESERYKKLKLPFRAEDLYAAIKELVPGAFQEKKKKPKRRTKEEQDILDRAKELLMRQRDMSEPDAFRYIQKTSMDMGRNLIESAEMILLMYN